MSEILKMIEGKQLTRGQADEILASYDRMLAMAKRPVSNKCKWCGLDEPCPCTTNTEQVLTTALESIRVINMEGENEHRINN